MRLIVFALAMIFAGCASPEEKARRQMEQQDTAAKKAMAERRRKSAMGSGDAASERGAEVMVPDESRTFNPSVARFGRASGVRTKEAYSNKFRFDNNVRTKSYSASGYETKSAWLGKLNFGTKTAATSEAREAGKSARTKDYATTDAREAGKSAAIPDVPDGERKFLGKEAERMKRGIRPEDQAKFENTWSGNLEPMTIEDVKKLLNKN